MPTLIAIFSITVTNAVITPIATPAIGPSVAAAIDADMADEIISAALSNSPIIFFLSAL